jgi:ABC-type glycerol-3-phosphate transport system permease component
MTTATQPKTKRSWARRITSNVGLAIAVFLLLLPILWGIGTALKPEADAFDNSLSSFLHAKEFSNFVTA